MHPHGVLFRSPVLTLALEGAIAKAMGSQRRLERIGGGDPRDVRPQRRPVADVRARARAGGPHRAAVSRARDGRLVRRDGPVLAPLAIPVGLQGALARDGAALRADAEAAHLRADRRAGRGAHDVAARADRRRAQLGLPVHVDPRRRVLAVRAAAARLRRGGGGVHGVADRPHARLEGRTERPDADHVRGSTGGRSSRSSTIRRGRATATRRRCGSATRRRTSASSTSTAR